MHFPRHPHQVKLKEIISRLDMRLLGVASSGHHQGQEDEGPMKEQGAREQINSRTTDAPRCTVLLSATLHQELGALATAIQRNPVPVGFSLQKV